MNNFRWYRKWRGGKWYRVRYIFDLGRQETIEWTQSIETDGVLWTHILETEDYN